MRILLLIPPYIPSYFNAGHHLPLFQVATYIREKNPSWQVTALDGGTLNLTWHDLAKELAKSYDFVGLFNDFDAVDGFGRTVMYCREILPQVKMFTFGRLSKQVPDWFKQFGFEGIAFSGDYESSVESFLLNYGPNTGSIPGLIVKTPEGYLQGNAGHMLSPEEWILPDTLEIPYAAYDRMYKNDLNKFCGIPDRRELVIPVARGCPVGCEFCDVPSMQGKSERRLSVDRVIKYIADQQQIQPFDYISFYAPTFTLNRRWVKELCHKFIELKLPVKWKCVTTIYHLNEELITLMAQAGCIRISLGVETISVSQNLQLPRIKLNTEAKIQELLAIAKHNGIEINAFIILGLPGDTMEASIKTIEWLIAEGARVRPTVYTPYNELHKSSSLAEVGKYNRQIFHETPQSPMERLKGYSLLFANDKDRPTEVMKKIALQVTDEKDQTSGGSL
ncbi:B12-binding domain-containing radical SAM protein [Xenorhabdus bovienii]|uniref:B12-binding domain-containing radical SAM protein n=1 Tax=Xenorhabdus bovienii TaxID=40576 RepID=UPI0023B34BAB|nr:radical SAM protein [Xenorhabdus bovienii]MDE9467348.1 radical SAM protein [Xenorhabdus bovienii]